MPLLLIRRYPSGLDGRVEVERVRRVRNMISFGAFEGGIRLRAVLGLFISCGILSNIQARARAQ